MLNKEKFPYSTARVRFILFSVMFKGQNAIY